MVSGASVKIVGMLNWYDEDPEWLYRCVKSAGLICDSIVAVDGPYALFPGAKDKPRSSNEEIAAIREAAGDMDCTIIASQEPWADGEVGKRNYLLQRARLEGADWLFRIDADEVVLDVADDIYDRIRRALASTRCDVAEVPFRYWRLHGGPWLTEPLRVLFRNLPMMWIVGHHGRVQGLLSDGDLVTLPADGGPEVRRVFLDRDQLMLILVPLAVIALPRLYGPRVPGLPSDADGFVRTGESGRVEGVERVWAAGDATIRGVFLARLAALHAADVPGRVLAEPLVGGVGGHVEPCADAVPVPAVGEPVGYLRDRPVVFVHRPSLGSPTVSIPRNDDRRNLESSHGKR